MLTTVLGQCRSASSTNSKRPRFAEKNHAMRRPPNAVAGAGLAQGPQLIQGIGHRGFTVIDSHLILESNQKMRAQMERLGGEVYKRFRIYGKVL